MEVKDKIRILSRHLEETDIIAINKAIEEAHKSGIKEERERIKHVICFSGHLVTTQYGHGYHIGDQLWLELFPKDNGKPNLKSGT